MNQNQLINENENGASLIAPQQLVDTYVETPDLISVEESVFKKTDRTQRTPPANKRGETPAGKESKQDTLMNRDKGSRESYDISGRMSETDTTARHTSPVRPRILWKRTEQEELLLRCKNIINKMKTATERQKNVSNDIKFGLVELEEAFSAISQVISEQRKTEAQLLKITGLQQTPTTSNITARQKRPAVSPADQQNQQEKKVREETSQATGEHTWKKVESRKERRSENLEAKAEDDNISVSTRSTAEVETTKRKAKKRSGKRRRLRPEALIIKPAQGTSYADVLEEIRSKVRPQESETEVQSIRRTRTGDVLLELGPNSKNTDGFCGALKDALGDQARILNLRPRVSIEIRDLDGFTTEPEVAAALKRDIPEVEEVKIKIFPCPRGQQVAIVEIREKWAAKLISTGKIKIGWVSCRVRERVNVTRCFRCCGFGHVAKECKGIDRSKLCYKCFGAGHKARECTATGNCMLCTEKGVEQAELTHPVGSGKCQVYREALQAAKNRR